MMKKLMAAGAPLAVVGLSFMPMQCAPTPGHPPDCTQRDENGDGYPDNGLSASGNTYTCTFSKSFQSAINETYIWVDVLCHGATVWVAGPGRNTDASAQEEQKAQGYCYPNGVAAGNPRSKHS